MAWHGWNTPAQLMAGLSIENANRESGRALLSLYFLSLAREATQGVKAPGGGLDKEHHACML
jgi:hypothetical protein